MISEFLDKIEEQPMEIEQLPTLRKRLDIRSKFLPTEEKEEIEEEEEEIIPVKRQKQQIRIGLTKGAREYLPMLRKKQKEELKERRQKQQEELKELTEFKKMKEQEQDESQVDKYNKLIKELQSEMIREEGEALEEEISELVL